MPSLNKHTLADLLRACPTPPPEDDYKRIPAFTGYMVLEVGRSADLWQEAQDAFGMGADGLMEKFVEMAEFAFQLVARCERANSDTTALFILRQSRVESYFEWNVVEPFAAWYAKEIIKHYAIEGADLPDSTAYAKMIDMTVDWLLGNIDGPKTRWSVEMLDGRTYFSDRETHLDAINDARLFHGATMDEFAMIRRVNVKK